MSSQEGLAKVAPEASKPVVVEHIAVQTAPITTYDSVSIDVMRMFGADFNTPKKTMEQLKTVSDWALKGVETTGDGLAKIRDIERKIGLPRAGESRISRLHDYLRIQRNIDDLLKRQDALRG
jgi:hypothetical protein